MPLGIDLHLHTRASDGQWTPAGLVARAASAGIGHIAITDHDVTDAIASARMYGVQAGVAVISGVEVTVHWQRVPLHLLLYGDAVLTPPVENLLARGREALDAWVRARASALPDRTSRTRLMASRQTLTVSALVRAARDCGISTDLHDAARYVAEINAEDPPGLALAEVAQIAFDAGAIPVLAHPMRDGSLTRALDESAIGALLDEVPTVLGLEVVHPRHDQLARDALATLASRRAILRTAGSDSHGPARARPPVAWPQDLARDFLHRIGA